MSGHGNGVASTGPIDTVVVAFGDRETIERTLEPLAALGGRIVVVDHGDGASARRAGELGALGVHDPTNPGFGSGQNRGVSMTTSPFVLVCNPDAVVDPASVARGAELLAARPAVAAVQGVIISRRSGAPERSQGAELGPVHLLGRAAGARGVLRFSLARQLATRSAILGDHAQRVPPGPTEVESLAATAVLVRRASFEEVGGFDPAFFLYGEDLDLCRRFRLAGWTLLSVPDLWAVHSGGASSSSPWRRELHWWRGTMGFAARWWGPMPWSVAMAAATARWVRLALRRPRGAAEALSALLIEPARDRRRELRRRAPVVAP